MRKKIKMGLHEHNFSPKHGLGGFPSDKKCSMQKTKVCVN